MCCVILEAVVEYQLSLAAALGLAAADVLRVQNYVHLCHSFNLALLSKSAKCLQLALRKQRRYATPLVASESNGAICSGRTGGREY